MRRCRPCCILLPIPCEQPASTAQPYRNHRLVLVEMQALWRQDGSRHLVLLTAQHPPTQPDGPDHGNRWVHLGLQPWVGHQGVGKGKRILHMGFSKWLLHLFFFFFAEMHCIPTYTGRRQGQVSTRSCCRMPTWKLGCLALALLLLLAFQPSWKTSVWQLHVAVCCSAVLCQSRFRRATGSTRKDLLPLLLHCSNTSFFKTYLFWLFWSLNIDDVYTDIYTVSMPLSSLLPTLEGLSLLWTLHTI